MANRALGLDFARRRIHKGVMQDTRMTDLSPAGPAQTGLPPHGLQRGEGMLAATAGACRLLLEAPDVMSAVPDVLRLLGEAAGADRVNLWRTQTDAEGARWLVVVSEWVAEGVTPYLGDPSKERCPESAKQSACCLLRAGQSLSLIPEGPQGRPGSNFDGEGTRTKALIPIMVDGEFSGVVGFDNTRQSRAIEPAELSALETAAGVIGAALHRERLISAVRHERERAAEQRMWELARANAVIRSNLERLAREPDMKAFLGHLLLEATRQFDAPSGAVIIRKPDRWLVAAHVRNGELAEPPFAASVPADSALADELSSADGPRYCSMGECRNEDSWPGMQEYHRSEGHAGMVVFPLVFGERNVGFIMLCFRRADAAALCNSELLVALAQQATLAIEMMHLVYSSKEAAILGERNRIGREIHDGLAQSFTGILMQLSAAEERGVGPGEDIARRIRDLAREGLAEARRSVMALRPDPARGGLPHALAQLAERSSVPGRVSCRFEGEDETTGVAPEHEHALLRIAQEAVSNAVRHGQPRQVSIQLRREPAHWLLRVEDDGAGMDDSPGRCARQGFGLTNMRERANAIGGEWRIDSRAGAGTRISVRLPRKTAAGQRPLTPAEPAAPKGEGPGMDPSNA